MDVIQQILVGVLIAALTSVITVSLSLWRFRTEKWWEKRAEVYSGLLATLHDAKAFAETHMDAEEGGKEVSDEVDAAIRESSKKAEAEIYRAMDVGSFYLSDEAVVRLKRYRKESSAANNADSWYEYLMNEYGAVNSCLVDMILIAKKDLKVRN